MAADEFSWQHYRFHCCIRRQPHEPGLYKYRYKLFVTFHTHTSFQFCTVWLSRDLSRLDLGEGESPQSLNSPPKIFGQNYIFFTIYYLLFIVLYSMRCAHVTERGHEVRRVLVDFKATNLLTAPIYRMLLKYNTRISMGKLNGNKIWVISDYYCVICF